MIKIYDSQAAYDNAAEPYDDCDEDIGITQEQQQVLSEYDDDIAELEQQLTDLLERREMYVNRDGLRTACQHEDLVSLGYMYGETVKCPHCGKAAQVW